MNVFFFQIVFPHHFFPPKMAFSLFIFVILFLCCVVSPSPDTPIPNYTISLETPPSNRWPPILSSLFPNPSDLLDTISLLYSETKKRLTLCPPGSPCASSLASIFASRYPDQAEELRSIAAYIAQLPQGQSPRPDYETLVIWQYFYEISHITTDSNDYSDDPFGCTSLICVDKTGRVYHGRNLDFASEAQYRLGINSRWTRNGKVAFIADQPTINAVGFPTVAGLNFAFSYNWRKDPEDKMTVEDFLNCASLPNTLAPLSSAVRQITEKNVSFQNAATIFERETLCAPAYIAVSGINAGEIIVRSRTKALKIDTVSKDGMWFAVQDNTDPWREPSKGDDRAGLARSVLKKMGQDQAASQNGLWEVLSTKGTNEQKGVLNNKTVYTAVYGTGLPFYVDAFRHETGQN